MILLDPAFMRRFGGLDAISRSIGQTLAHDTGQSVECPRSVINSQALTIAVTEVKNGSQTLPDTETGASRRSADKRLSCHA